MIFSKEELENIYIAIQVFIDDREKYAREVNDINVLDMDAMNEFYTLRDKVKEIM